MIRFDETVRGRKFYDGDLPRLIKAIEENTKAIQKSNELKEKELELKGTPLVSLTDGKETNL